MSRSLPLATLVLAPLALASATLAQPVSVPRQGDNQKASVTQHVGLVSITVDYSSPDIHAPDGSDRRGKIWGGLVPYGWHSEGFGTCDPKCPWRGGADENTVVTLTHDVLVEGQPLAAGAYGLHFVPGESEWLVIFSKNSTAWGSFFYDEAEDALRVTVRPEKAPYREWLTYDIPRTVAGRAWKGRFRGQKQKWYAMRFTGSDSEINIVSPAGHKQEFIDWRWEPMHNLPDLIVPFKRPVYERVVQEFSRFAGK